jgi:hypothetical protein
MNTIEPFVVSDEDPDHSINDSYFDPLTDLLLPPPAHTLSAPVKEPQLLGTLV